jgi:hypothetical protein
LSELWAAALPAIVSDFGAQKARVLAEDLGWVVDPWQPEALADLIRTLIADASAIERRTRRLLERPHRDEAAMVGDHVRLWLELADRGPRRALPAGAEADALREFSAGAPPPTSAWRRSLGLWVEELRKTEWYRDLPLRRLLPESARAGVERGLLRAMGKKRPMKG